MTAAASCFSEVTLSDAALGPWLGVRSPPFVCHLYSSTLEIFVLKCCWWLLLPGGQPHPASRGERLLLLGHALILLVFMYLIPAVVASKIF